MNRSQEIFQNMIKTSFFGEKNYKLLNRVEREMIDQFLMDYDHLSIPDREMKLNRLFLDNPNKPKKWKYILELLSWTNSRIRMIEIHNLPFDANLDNPSPEIRERMKQ